MIKTLDIYTDGSFNGRNASWAFIVVQNDAVLFQDRGVLEGDINRMWQIGGEIKAAENAVLWAKKMDCLININYDYIGVENWATNAWKAKNDYTKAYKTFMQEHSKYINGWTKIFAHSGHRFNDFVDRLAKNN